MKQVFYQIDQIEDIGRPALVGIAVKGGAVIIPEQIRHQTEQIHDVYFSIPIVVASGDLNHQGTVIRHYLGGVEIAVAGHFDLDGVTAESIDTRAPDSAGIT